MRLGLISLCAGLVFVVAAIPTTFAAPLQPFTLDDYWKFVRVSDPQISPDGQRIAFVVSRPDMSSDTVKNTVMIIDIADGSVRRLTQARDDAGMPRWSPDGAQLAVLATPSCTAHPCTAEQPQVLVYPMNGGDPRTVSSAPRGVDFYVWRPDGRAIAYHTEDDATGKSVNAYHGGLFTVGDQDFLSQGTPAASQIWLQPLGGVPFPLTTGMSSTFLFDGSWSPDGTKLAFSRLPDVYYRGHENLMQACILDTGSKSVSCLTDSGTYSFDPAFAPAGDAIAYRVGHDGYWSVDDDVRARIGLRTVPIGSELDRNVTWRLWTHDGKALWLVASDRTRVGLWYAPLDGTPRRIDLGDVNIDTFSKGSVANGGGLAFIGDTPGEPPELYYLAPNASVPRRLTNYHAWFETRKLAQTRECTWTNDGFHEDGALTYPADYIAGKRYPLVLYIHGGPTLYSSSNSFDLLVQVFAAHDYFVLQPNYRGSDNLGFAYAKAIVGDVDTGPGRDIVAGVKTLEATGMIDPSRVGVSGWSAGGMLTSWLIGHSGTWKVAVSGAAINDLIEEYDLSDIITYWYGIMGNLSPWRGNGHAKYIAESPITYASRVTTPTLILSDTGDYRVPSVQSYEFYHALKDQGETVEFVAIPAYGHSPADPVRRVRVFKLWVGWMVMYLK